MTREQENYVSELCSAHGGEPIEILAVGEATILVAAPNGDRALVTDEGIPDPVRPDVTIQRSTS